MKTRKTIIIFGILLFGILAIGFGAGAMFSGDTSAPFSASTSYQFYQPSFNTYYSSEQVATYWPILRDIQNDQCEATSDFIVMIKPGGCSPAVVRSDLLEEQNVPVFCQLDAIRVNPLIKVSSIESISFKGDYPEGVAGISFHPARAAVRTYKTLLGSPLINNIGYVVIILKQNKVEKTMPEEIFGNLTATIYYDAEKAYGVGKADFYVPVMTDEDWRKDYNDYSFWQGKGFLRVLDIDGEMTRVALYTDKEHVFRTLAVKEGETSGNIYFPGFYCKAGLQVKLHDVVSPEKQARLNVDGSEIWVREGGSILNGACKVVEIAAFSDGTGKVSISCPGNRFDLIKQKGGADIKVGDAKTAGTFEIGKSVFEKYKLAYIGTLPDKFSKDTVEYYEKDKEKKETEVKTKEGMKDFVILVESDHDISDKDLASVMQRVGDAFERTKKFSSIIDFEKQIGTFSGLFGSSKVMVLVAEKERGVLDKEKKEKKLTFNKIAVKAKDKEIEIGKELPDDAKATAKTYFDLSDKSTMKLVELYPHEKTEIYKYAEENLWAQYEFAISIGQQLKAKTYLEKFIEVYPYSAKIEMAKQKLSELDYFDFSKSNAVVFVNNVYHYIGVDSFKAVDKSVKGVRIEHTTDKTKSGWYSEKEVIEGEKVKVPKDSKKPEGDKEDKVLEQWVIQKIEPGKVTIVHEHRDADKTTFTQDKPYVLAIGDSVSLSSGGEFFIKDIRADKVAHISLIPKVDNTKSEADFTFKIGIEKRNIKLSTDRIKDMIKNLNETIEDWENINEKLGKLVKGMKGACFAVSGVLMLKNLVSGFGGKTMARQKVMESFRARCERLIAEKKYRTRSECYNALSPEINKQVSVMEEAIKLANKKISDSEVESGRGGLLGSESVIDREKSIAKLKETLRGVKTGVMYDSGGGVMKELAIEDLESFDELRAVILVNELKSKGAGEEIIKSAEKERDSLLAYTKKVKEREVSLKLAKVNLPEKFLDAVAEPFSEGDKFIGWSGKSFSKADLEKLINDETTEKIFTNSLTSLKKDGTKAIQLVPVGSALFLVTLNPSSGSERMVVDGIYNVKERGEGKITIDGGKLNRLPKGSGVSFIRRDGGVCKNTYINPKVKYYQTAPDEKLPSIVPFDLKDGWYVKVPSKGFGIFSGEKKSYLASGDVSYFYICNVGGNGLEDNAGNDDRCQSFDVNTYDKVESFGGCGLSSSEVQQLARRARNAIQQAAEQYGKSSIRITGVDRLIDAELVSQDELFECEEFMSPGDCRLLFNLCDPVVCPSSRCDLGGKLKVANVVQSGIIGSIFLCLPNFPQVLIPICLTGLHAGIESFVSILKAERDCLQHNLDTGEHVGICDEITSIYLCEFFWRQFAPFIDVIVPRMIEMAYGQNVRGGGEYLTVQYAWDTMQKSIDNFKNVYAQNVFRAFQFRNVQEVGTMFCRGFLGTSVPGSASFLDSLLEPESPVQFYAHFSEITLTEATVPATSHYKVYYHIYAGKDKGAYFAVYLKNPPATGYYYQNPRVMVKTGYIGKGEYADESIDFSAPAGYKELCVVIDAQEWCGFGQVSTSFALDYINNKYIEEQANQTEIKTEKECISGSPSVWPLINPNIQAGAEEAAMPEIALRGVVRVCATENPGNSTELKKSGSARWVNVGYCGDPLMRCWLDSDSVKEAVEFIDAVEGTDTMEQLKKAADAAIGGDGILGEENSKELLAKIRERIEKLDVELDEDTLRDKVLIEDLLKKKGLLGKDEEDLSDLEKVKIKGYLNVDRAEAFVLESELYRKIVNALVKGGVDKAAVREGVGGAGGGEVDEGEEGGEGLTEEEEAFWKEHDEEILKEIEEAEKEAEEMDKEFEKIVRSTEDYDTILTFEEANKLEEIVPTVYEDERILVQNEDGSFGTLKVGLGKKMGGGKIVVTGNVNGVGTVGKEMTKGEISILGYVFDSVGAFMYGGEINIAEYVKNSVGFVARGGKIFVNGDVDHFSGVGYLAKNTKIKIMGNVKGMVGGILQSGSEIYIDKDVEGTVGKEMKGGRIIINGNIIGTDASVGEKMKGGEITIKGKLEEGVVGKEMTGGKIFLRGGLGESAYISKTVKETCNVKGKCEIWVGGKRCWDGVTQITEGGCKWEKTVEIIDKTKDAEPPPAP